MPVTVHLAKAKIKDNNGKYHAIDAFSDQLSDAKDNALNEIQQKYQDIETLIQNKVEDGQKMVENAVNTASKTYNKDLTTYTNSLILETDLADIIAESFDQEMTYTKNTYVRYPTLKTSEEPVIKLYQLTEDHPAGTSWENTSKSEIILGRKMQEENGVPVLIRISDITSGSSDTSDYQVSEYLLFKRNIIDLDFDRLTALNAVFFDDKITINGEGYIPNASGNPKIRIMKNFTNDTANARQVQYYYNKPYIGSSIQSASIAMTGAYPSYQISIQNYQQSTYFENDAFAWIVANSTNRTVGGAIILKTATAENVNGFNAYLKKHPITIYYRTENLSNATSIYVAIPKTELTYEAFINRHQSTN